MKFINWNKGKGWAKNSITEIRHICIEQKPSIFSIHEFNFRQEDCLDDIEVEGYDILLDNMYLKYGMARTALYISQDIKYERREKLEIEGESLIAITIHPNRTKPVNLISYYRQWQILTPNTTIPGSQTEKSQKTRLELILKKSQKSIFENETILLSDTNIDFTHDYTNPEKLKTHQKKLIPLVKLYKEYLFDYGVCLIKTKPTKIYFKKPSTSIDHCMTNQPNKIKSHLIQRSGLSDHLYGTFNWASKGPQNEPKYLLVRDYKNFNWAQANAELFASQILKDASTSQDPETITAIIQSEITSVLDKQAPITKIQLQKKVPAFATTETRRLFFEKNLAFEKAKTTQNSDDIRNYNTLRNRVKKKLSQDKRKQMTKQFSEIEGDPKNQWKNVKKT